MVYKPMMSNPVNKEKSEITANASVKEGEKRGMQGILLVPQPTNDVLDPLVQSFQRIRFSAHIH